MVRSRELNGDFPLFSQALYRLSLSYWANPSPQTSALPAELLHPRVSVGNWFFLRLVFVHYERSSWGARDGPVVRALTSHQCGPGSTPGVDAICGLSMLLVLSLTPRGFSPGTLVFSSPQIPTLPNSNSIWNARTRLNEVIGTPKFFVGKKAIF